MDLPVDLELPLATGAPWWYWLGGRVALDFVNTRRERWRREVETLATPEDLAEWCARADLLRQPAGATRDHLWQARRLREAIDAGVRAVVEQSPTPTSAITEINSWLPAVATTQRLSVNGAGRLIMQPAPPSDPVAHAIGLLAHDACLLLGTDDSHRVRICASPTCSARFYDASRAGTRRWCSMRFCGNTEKARRHRAQRRNASGSSDVKAYMGDADIAERAPAG